MGTESDRQEPTDDQLAVRLSWPMGPPAPRRKFGRRATDRIGTRASDTGAALGLSPSAPMLAPAELGQVVSDLAVLRAELSELRGEMASLRKEMASLRRRIPLKA